MTPSADLDNKICDRYILLGHHTMCFWRRPRQTAVTHRRKHIYQSHFTCIIRHMRIPPQPLKEQVQQYIVLCPKQHGTRTQDTCNNNMHNTCHGHPSMSRKAHTSHFELAYRLSTSCPYLLSHTCSAQPRSHVCGLKSYIAF